MFKAIMEDKETEEQARQLLERGQELRRLEELIFSVSLFVLLFSCYNGNVPLFLLLHFICFVKLLALSPGTWVRKLT